MGFSDTLFDSDFEEKHKKALDAAKAFQEALAVERENDPEFWANFPNETFELEFPEQGKSPWWLYPRREYVHLLQKLANPNRLRTQAKYDRKKQAEKKLEKLRLK